MRVDKSIFNSAKNYNSNCNNNVITEETLNFTILNSNLLKMKSTDLCYFQPLVINLV